MLRGVGDSLITFSTLKPLGRMTWFLLFPEALWRNCSTITPVQRHLSNRQYWEDFSSAPNFRFWVCQRQVCLPGCYRPSWELPRNATSAFWVYWYWWMPGSNNRGYPISDWPERWPWLLHNSSAARHHKPTYHADRLCSWRRNTLIAHDEQGSVRYH